MVSARPDQDVSAHRFRGSAPEPISVAWVLAVLLLWRRTIIGVNLACVTVAAAVALLRPTTYTTNFSFVPELPPDASRSGLAGLAGQLGVSLGAQGSQTQSPQFYADLLNTHQLLAPIANDNFSDRGRRVKLSEFLGVSGTNPAVVTDKTVEILRTKVLGASVAARTTGVVSVRVRTESPDISLGISERVLLALNQFNLLTRQSQ